MRIMYDKKEIRSGKYGRDNLIDTGSRYVEITKSVSYSQWIKKYVLNWSKPKSDRIALVFIESSLHLILSNYTSISNDDLLTI